MIGENGPERVEVTIADSLMRVVQLGAGPLNHICRDMKSLEVTREERDIFWRKSETVV